MTYLRENWKLEQPIQHPTLPLRCYLPFVVCLPVRTPLMNNMELPTIDDLPSLELELPTGLVDMSPDIRQSRKTLSRRRESIANQFSKAEEIDFDDDDDDDDEMRAELDRLSIAQVSLQHELILVMKMVETMQTVEESFEEQETKLVADLNDNKLPARNLTSGIEKMEWTITSTRNLNVLGDDSFTIEEEEPAKHKGFAQGFFELVKPKESLESQKKKQQKIVKETLQSIEPGLEQMANCAQEAQELLVHANTTHKLQELMKQTPKSLEEEKLRQEEILRLTLSPDLLQEMNHQQAQQARLLADKKEELRVLAEKKSELDQTRREIQTKLKTFTTPVVRSRKGFWRNPKGLGGLLVLNENEPTE